jgi:hypothetical protein
MNDHAQLVKLTSAGDFPRVTLQEPGEQGFALLAGVVDRRPRFAWFLESGRKRRLIAELKRQAELLAADARVEEAVVFKTLLVPPGRGRYLRQRSDVHVARYDIVVLTCTTNPAVLPAVRSLPAFEALETALHGASDDVLDVDARMGRCIGPVDHDRDGVFLFNFFAADSREQNLAVWEYTAGWFQDQTGLDNSTLLIPLDEDAVDYTVINHCRWDGLGEIVPSLVFKPSFRNYVLAHFEANDTAAIPVLYRLA